MFAFLLISVGITPCIGPRPKHTPSLNPQHHLDGDWMQGVIESLTEEAAREKEAEREALTQKNEREGGCERGTHKRE